MVYRSGYIITGISDAYSNIIYIHLTYINRNLLAMIIIYMNASIIDLYF